MAYTTEEQDFQSFLQKLKQVLPQIILSIALAFAVYYGYNKYKDYTNNKVITQYQEFQTILNSNSSLDKKASKFEQFIADYPKYPLAINGILDLVKQFVANKEYQKALNLINSVKSDNINNTNLLAITKAKLLWQLGNNSQAIALLTNISDDTWFDQAHALAGDIYYQSNDFKNAIVQYNQTKDHINKSINQYQKQIDDIVKGTNNKTEIQDIKSKIQSLQGQLVWIQTRLNVALTQKNNVDSAKKSVSEKTATNSVNASTNVEANNSTNKEANTSNDTTINKPTVTSPKVDDKNSPKQP